MATAFISTFKYSDSLTITGISFLTAVVCEAISWFLIYRRTSYKSLKFAIDKASKKLDFMKTDLKKPKPKTKIDRVETSLKESTRDLSLFKLKSGAVVAIVLFVVFGFLNSLYDGKSVAKLPFVPLRIVQRMSHRGLQGDDPTDCSMAFLYFLCSISIRTNLQKFLGFSPPRGAAAGDELYIIHKLLYYKGGINIRVKLVGLGEPGFKIPMWQCGPISGYWYCTASKGLRIQWCNVKRLCDMKTLIAIWGKFPSGNNGSA
ncbi:hypothetical protein R6Q59_011636 [Mikania micrantha]